MQRALLGSESLVGSAGSDLSYMVVGVVVAVIIATVALVIATCLIIFLWFRRGSGRQNARWAEIAGTLGLQLAPFEDWMESDPNRVRGLMASHNPSTTHPTLHHVMYGSHGGAVVLVYHKVSAHHGMQTRIAALLDSPLGIGLDLQEVVRAELTTAEEHRRFLDSRGAIRLGNPTFDDTFFVQAKQPQRIAPLLQALSSDLLRAAGGGKHLRLQLCDTYVAFVSLHVELDIGVIRKNLEVLASLAQRVSTVARSF